VVHCFLFVTFETFLKLVQFSVGLVQGSFVLHALVLFSVAHYKMFGLPPVFPAVLLNVVPPIPSFVHCHVIGTPIQRTYNCTVEPLYSRHQWEISFKKDSEAY